MWFVQGSLYDYDTNPNVPPYDSREIPQNCRANICCLVDPGKWPPNSAIPVFWSPFVYQPPKGAVRSGDFPLVPCAKHRSHDDIANAQKQKPYDGPISPHIRTLDRKFTEKNTRREQKTRPNWFKVTFWGVKWPLYPLYIWMIKVTGKKLVYSHKIFHPPKLNETFQASSLCCVDFQWTWSQSHSQHHQEQTLEYNDSKNYSSLRMRGSQNWWFGDPRTLL